MGIGLLTHTIMVKVILGKFDLVFLWIRMKNYILVFPLSSIGPRDYVFGVCYYVTHVMVI